MRWAGYAVWALVLAFLGTQGCSGDASDDEGSNGGTTASGGSSSGGTSSGGSSSGGSSSGGTTGDSGGGDANVTDACAWVDSKTFASVEEQECGIGPDGPAMCNWTITFADGTFDWFYTDVIESGEYTCTGLTISSDNGYSGSVDADTGHLSWENVEYAPQPQ